MIGCLEEQSSEELVVPRQFMIAWLIRDSLTGSFVSTGKISVMSGGYFASYRVVWDPGDSTTYEQVRESFARRDFANAVSRHMEACMIWQQSRSGHTLQDGLIQPLPILGQGWGSEWTDCITYSRRVQSVLVDQPAELTHFPVITWEYGAARIIEIHPWHWLIRSASAGLTPNISDYLQTVDQAMVVD